MPFSETRKESAESAREDGRERPDGSVRRTPSGSEDLRDDRAIASTRRGRGEPVEFQGSRESVSGGLAHRSGRSDGAPIPRRVVSTPYRRLGQGQGDFRPDVANAGRSVVARDRAAWLGQDDDP